VDPATLQYYSSITTPGNLGEGFSCSNQTICRCQVEYGLARPGNPVYVRAVNDEGEVVRHHVSSHPATTSLTDSEHDRLISEVLESFPAYGHCMLKGSLLSRGHRVPDHRIRDSYIRVHGVTQIFGDRGLHRKIYNVPGANSLWHHDGQHGLIRF